MSSFSLLVFWAIFCFLTFGMERHPSLACLDEEKVGLLKLKQAFQHVNNKSWLSSWREGSKNCCNWVSVECDSSSKRVVQLLLDDTVGYLPDDRYPSLDHPGGRNWSLDLSLFSPFQELKNLSLAGNSLGGFIGELRSSNLEYLDLSYNKLVDVPSFFSRSNISLKYLNLGGNYLTSLSRFGGFSNFGVLKELDLSFNQINGSISEGLCMLRNLEVLYLSDNHLSGVIPLCLSNLTSLKILSLSGNSLVGNIPSILFPNLKSLVSVDLSGNHFEGLFSFGTLSSNSKLEFFKLDCNNTGVVVDTENPPWTPLFQLEDLRLSRCKLNEPTGVIPKFLVNQYNLRYLDLRYNNLSGKIPSWLILNNTNLGSLLLGGNLFTGPILLYPDSRNLNLKRLDISSNQIQDKLPDFIGSVLPNMKNLNLSANMFYGSIPPSVGDMEDLLVLDLSSNNFSGGIPEHLAIGCTSLSLLKLCPPFPAKWNLTKLSILNLDNNHFSGEISSSLRNSIQLEFLNLHNNSISGEIPNWLGGFSRLISLVLSDNSFEGHIPDNFCKLQWLKFLDLSHNKISGFIPSCVNLTSLKSLHLQGNNLTGPLPHALSRSLSLVTLDITDNKFYGELPDWISSLSSMRFLLMKNNSFDGSIPSDICHLKNISVLDLSSNKFAGLIPSCLYQTSFGSTEINHTFPIQDFELYFYYPNFDSLSSLVPPFGVFPHIDGTLLKRSSNHQEEEICFMSKSRLENYRSGPLHYIFGMDLSQNELTGHIPDEFGNLTNIQILNLSHNHLAGSIPMTLSNLKRIESLDLSYNRLSGQIPSELTQLNSMSTFLVIHNNLSGRLPDMKAQFGTFNESSYEGNPFLCGSPLARICTRSGQLPPSKSAEEEKEEKESFGHAFMMAFLVSYFSAFVGTISFIYFMVRWREQKLIEKARRRRISHPRMP